MSADPASFECGCIFDEVTGLPVKPCSDHGGGQVDISCKRDGCDVVYQVRADTADGDDGYCSDECAVAEYEEMRGRS